MDRDLAELFDRYRDALKSEPTLGQLMEIREHLDRFVLHEAMRTLDRINDPQRLALVRDAVNRCKRAAQDLQARRRDSREFIRQVGITGGTTLCFGAPIAALALASPLIAAFPLAAGVYILLRSGNHSKNQSIEISLLEQIVERIEAILEG